MFGPAVLRLGSTPLLLVLRVLANIFNFGVMLVQQCWSGGVKTVAIIVCFISLSNILLQISTFVLVASVWVGVLCWPDLPFFCCVVLFVWLSSSSVSFWSVAWLSVFLCDHLHLLPHPDALHDHAPDVTEAGRLPLQTHAVRAEEAEQLSHRRVVPAGLQGDGGSGLGLPHHLALLLPHHLCLRAECRHALLELVVLLCGLCNPPQPLQQKPAREAQSADRQGEELKHTCQER
ncbi:hypothetical protein ABVT39_000522 [Epinephelus coioides]